MHKLTSISLGFSMFSLLNSSPNDASAVSSSKKTQAANTKSQDSTKPDGRNLLNAKTTTLKNGLQVVVVEDHGVPRVSVGVLYKVGSCDDPENLFGISHMTEHMFFHGSKKYPKIDETVGKLGGHLNAFTSSDFTAFIIDTTANALRTVCEIESDRMENFHLKNVDIFDKEKMAVFEERLMVVENQPDGPESEYMRMALSPQHPYGREVIGLQQNILNYSVDAVMAHYKKWYAPNNAVLIVVGDVDAPAVFKMAETYFGHIKSREVPPRVRVKNASSEIQHKLTFYSKNVASNKVDLEYNAPHHTTHNMKEIYALKILLEILFGGVVYDFCNRFLQKNELVAGFSVNAETPFDPAPIVVSASLRSGITCEKFLKEYFKRIHELSKNGVKEEDFKRAKQAFLTTAIYKMRDGHSNVRMQIVECLSEGRSLEQLEESIENITAVTIGDVNNILRQFIDKKPFAIVKTIVKPAE